MKLSEESRITLLTHMHRSVEESANTLADSLNNGKIDQVINYPPNGGLTEEESKSLELLKNNETLRNALRKVFASNSASVLFELFNIVDGTGDPDPDLGSWSEVLLVDMPKDFNEHIEFLHDGFYETYWNWRKKRDSSFKLDLLDD